ncbi:hypothetical protein GF382_01925, partial [Candidatus Falkowbacteria bacterium]|nr:hypothetical protein [Candidatus Falkowbacteria bacterium]
FKMNTFAIISILTGISSSFLGLFMFIRGKSGLQRLWGVFCFSVAIWGFGAYMLAVSADKDRALAWIRIAHIGVILIPAIFFNFVNYYLRSKWKAFTVLAYVLAFFFLFTNFYDGWFVGDMCWMFNEFYYPCEPGIFYTLFVAFFSLLVGLSIIKLWLAYRQAKGAKRNQILYFLVLLISFVGGGANFLPPYGIRIYPIFNILIFAFPFLIGYAIAAHRLMDMKIILRKSSVYFFSFFTLLLLLVPIELAVVYLPPSFRFFFNLAVLVAAVYTFPYIKDLFFYIANKYFSYSFYRPQDLISEVSDKLISTLKSSLIYDFLFKSFVDVFQINNFLILKYDKSQGIYKTVFLRGYKLKRKTFSKDDYLEKEFIKKSEAMVKEELKSCRLEPGSKDSICHLISSKVDITVPLVSKNRIIGLMALGSKGSGDMYSEVDLYTLKIIGAQLASAMESRGLYERIHQLNRSLKRKVDEQTADIEKKAMQLKEKNKRLKKLLEMKNDFLRVVNHQLNTPISIIKNSVFMIKQKNFSQDKGLKFIDEGIKRMEEITHDFWKAFVFEGEALKMQIKKTNIRPMIEETVASIREASKVKENKVSINIDKLEELPEVLCDNKELAQAFYNLLNNSVAYTEEGSIDIYFKTEGSYLKVFVKDSGSGIDKNEHEKIFEKFTRGSRAISSRPGGSGLGLYISKKIIEACGGKLRLEESTPGKGSTFSFTLPIA